jgi:hypothetical protein
MVLNQNQFKISSLPGTKVFGHEDNVLEGQFYNASAVATLAPGEFVCLDPATPAGSVPRLIKGADVDGKFFGVVLTNPLSESFAVGEFVQVGILSCGVLCEAAAAINVGEDVTYDPATKKVSAYAAPGLGDPTPTKVGVALGKATTAGDLIKVFVRS